MLKQICNITYFSYSLINKDVISIFIFLLIIHLMLSFLDDCAGHISESTSDWVPETSGDSCDSEDLSRTGINQMECTSGEFSGGMKKCSNFSLFIVLLDAGPL